MDDEDDALRYDRMVEDALRGVVRTALGVAADKGLPGDHHFYVTFRTHAPGVAVSNQILARHPDEMTVVLQHQFWDLVVTDEYLEVTLSFSGVPERLHIPFSSITGFADPPAKFGLQFQTVDGEIEDDEEAEEAPPPPPVGDDEGSGKVVALDAFRKK